MKIGFKKIGFTGTQKGMTDEQKLYIMKLFKNCAAGSEFEIHSGDCIGADKDFVDILEWIEKKGWCVFFKKIGHIPNIDTKRAFCKYDEERIPKPYLERNHNIVDESDYLIATPGDYKEQLRSGTWSTIRYARKKGMEITIVYPDGSVKIENRKKS